MISSYLQYGHVAFPILLLLLWILLLLLLFIVAVGVMSPFLLLICLSIQSLQKVCPHGYNIIGVLIGDVINSKHILHVWEWASVCITYSSNWYLLSNDDDVVGSADARADSHGHDVDFAMVADIDVDVCVDAYVDCEDGLEHDRWSVVQELRSVIDARGSMIDAR